MTKSRKPNVDLTAADREGDFVFVPEHARIVVRVGGRIVAQSVRAVRLHEKNHPPILYFPRADVDMELLRASGGWSFCPYRGVARHFDIPIGGDRAISAAWSYEFTLGVTVSAIRGYIAFSPDRVDALDAWESFAAES